MLAIRKEANMTYDDIKKTIPEKRPFFTKSFADGAFGLSSGMLLVLEDNETGSEWASAILDALLRFDLGDYGNFYDDEDYVYKGHEYGSYPSPFGDTVWNGSIVIHTETHSDSWGVFYDKIVFFWYER